MLVFGCTTRVSTRVFYFYSMHEYRYAQDDYLLTIYYEGRSFKYRAKMYHIDRSGTYWHFFAKDQVHELKFDSKTGKLQHLVQHGESAFPESFLQVLEQEFERIEKKP